jgi:hypothetical protein
MQFDQKKNVFKFVGVDKEGVVAKEISSLRKKPCTLY